VDTSHLFLFIGVEVAPGHSVKGSISVPVSHDTLLLGILAWVAAQINNRFIINKQQKYKTKLYNLDYMMRHTKAPYSIQNHLCFSSWASS